jgi:ubiquinone/menaquinone biosynthesis C-methylase UbiE
MVEWDQILLRREYHPESPDRIVVDLISILARRRAQSVLDLGCGAGRHVMYLAESGFKTHGADLSDRGLKLTKKRLKSRKIDAEIIKCDMNSLPYIQSCFDAVVCVQTIYHQTLKGIQETVSEIHRILKKGGLLLANFHSKRSSKYGKGIEVEENTFMQENGPEKGVLHHFFDENELRALLGHFRVDFEVREKKVDSYLRSRFIVLAEKI